MNIVTRHVCLCFFSDLQKIWKFSKDERLATLMFLNFLIECTRELTLIYKENSRNGI